MHDRVLLITGASSGIGAATARAAAREGYQLVLAARSADKLTSLAQELGPENVLTCEVDVTDLSYCQIWCMSIRRRLCRIDHPPVLHPETERYSRPASVG
ncbi:SDR family NAD(P)-dependent oxidoreductase [Vreelandella aquamarina]|uniref:Short chain dehydrogenase n=1 Tax=Vreelandella aquamarina TaxID=77097 RepID=A0A1H8ISX3_9GAMM|nr:short chain dehydrogenase [Halomonas aquamarina]